MSLWGCRTGYDYESQRVRFLREMYKAESRAKLLAVFHDEEPLDVPTLMQPLPPPIVPTSRVLLSRHKLPPLAHPAPTLAPMTTSQLAYRAHQLNDIKSFAQSRGDRGRVRDKQTEYREQVFTMWNINGIKQPAVFRP
ncbi:hypothetical protein AB1Y20_015527 [Prymnesium parvum]|uniref:Uncharacterized protein n=1 Tax=Prymnesium parvum TaxID=97485 RepID=A0AB34JYR2_PRYPA|mmetsp:Transcript_23825/g.57452  ORF Transcript_23825/g.57452 Transcript_23825/m.57452 type:complete len:138 (+) Transcript_23825:131-544(+)